MTLEKANKNYLLLFGFLMLIVSCRKDTVDLIETPDDQTYLTEILVEATFNGLISDINGDAIPGAAVILGEEKAFTDRRGYFKISDRVSIDGAYMKVVADDYVTGFMNVLPSSKGLGHVRMRLPEMNKQSPSDIGIGQDGQSLSIGLGSNAVFNHNGSVFTDSVLVQATYIDVAHTTFDEIVPGELCGIGIGARVEPYLIDPFAMMVFEAEGEEGEVLTLSSSLPVTIEVADGFQNAVPAEIPTWHYNELEGIWIEKGLAFLQDGYYNFDIDRLGRWACGTTNDFVILSGQIKGAGNNSNVKLRITNGKQFSNFKIFRADNNGYYWTKVYKGTPMVIEVLDVCGNIVKSETIESLDSDATVNVELDADTDQTIHVQGNLICGLNTMVDGYVFIQSDDQTKYIVETGDNGLFQTDIINCGAAEYAVTGVNYIGDETGTTITYQPDTLIQVENLEGCKNNLAYFVSFKFADREIKSDIYSVSGNTEFGDFLAFDIEFEAETAGDKAVYKISVIWYVVDQNFQVAFIPFVNEGSPSEYYTFESKEIRVIDHGTFLEGNANLMNFTNTVNGVSEEGSFHFRIEKL